jgi:UDP-N-acetylmuramate dehydrogenase
MERRTAALEHRKRAQKVGMPNAGSVFRNPPGSSAWKLIDACGLRGFSIGGAQISPSHTNFIINTGTASAADVVALIAHVQREVYKNCGITLEPEIHFLSEEFN